MWGDGFVRNSMMKMTIVHNSVRRLAPFVLAGTAAVAIAAAPVAAAADDPHLQCSYQGDGNSQCESPGNAQLTATPPDVQYGPQYPYFFGGPIVLHHIGGIGGHGMGGHR
jgi:hypothetical protein